MRPGCRILFFIMLLGAAAYAQVNAVVSVLPQQTFLQKLGGEHVRVTLMVPPGSSPHSYEPKASQMKEVATADLYFAVGIEFEEAWLPKFNAQNRNMRIVFTQKNIDKIKMEERHHQEDEGHDHEEHGEHEEEEHDDHEGHHHHHDGLDPHVWTSPANVKIMARAMTDALIKQDPKNKSSYEKNLQAFLSEVDAVDAKCQKLLEPLPKPARFMVFHPAWGYFARDYGLEQLAIEVEGKAPKPKQLAHLIKEAKEEKVRAVFTAPEFSDKAAKQIAKEVGVPVVSFSPLHPKWGENLINLAETIAKGVSR